MGMEFEVKFAAEPDIQAAILEAYPGDYRQIRMETTYFDTADGALSARHITLRRRMENGLAVCTVKAPIAGQGRGEWECAGDNIEDAILELCKLGAPKELLYLTVNGVAPVCGARFTRQAAELSHLGGKVELALDSGVLLGMGAELPLQEVEVELKSGEPEVALDFARQLQARFGLREENKSKFRRALALAKGEQP